MSFGVRVKGRLVSSSASIPSVSEVFSRRSGCSILGGNSSGEVSVWACEPKDEFLFYEGRGEVFEELEAALGKYRLDGDKGQLPDGIFCGGWIGYFGYELGRYIEKLPCRAVDDLGMALVRLCFYDRCLCYDHANAEWWVVGLEIDGEKEAVGEKLDDIEGLLREAESVEVERLEKGELEDVAVDEFECNIGRDYYFEALDKISRYIYEGDVYQINFSQRFSGDFEGEAIKLYHWQNQYNPSPYAAYIDGGDFVIVSASPEMFLTVRDGVMSTKPIKGTRRRVEGFPEAERINAANFAELAASEKEQAELNMIIDLERNDLTRVCEYGTIKVIQPRTIEAYPTVFHAVATVQGKLRAWREEGWFCDILRGTFPGGSITGAPKIRAMEIIDELEPTQRGVYTGSIGYIGLDGSVCLNIAIRTIIIRDKKAFVQTGGGIVADSESEFEWQETITKARALLAGISAVNGGSLQNSKVREKSSG